MKSRIVGQIHSVDYDPDMFESEPYTIPYFDNKKLKIGFVEAKHEPYLNQADNVLETFLCLDPQNRVADSELVFNYYNETLKHGYTQPLDIKDVPDVWNFVYPTEIMIHWD